jgi:phenylacetate-coenzyme A ligase PaaK-like adenylate-forming protein
LHIVEENVVFEYVQGELLLTSLTDVLQPTIQLRTGWSARIETEPCDCGRAGRRLVGLHEIAPPGGSRRTQERLVNAAHN